MKHILIILTILLAQDSKGQFSEDALSSKAFDLFINEKYDSATVIYKSIIKLDSIDRPAYYYSQIGKCYQEMNKNDSAKSFYKRCLSFPLSSNFLASPQRKSCLGISELFISEHKYELAIEYLRLAEKEYPFRKICNAGEFERNLILKVEFAKCYEGLNKIDSAISFLTPYMFQPAEDLTIDSLEYINYLDYYFKLLSLKYNKCELKKILNQSLSNIYYKKELDTSIINTANAWHEIYCSINFLGAKVIISNVIYDNISWSEEAKKEYELGNLLIQFKKTPIYQLIIKNCNTAYNKRFAAMLARQLYFSFTLLSSLASA